MNKLVRFSIALALSCLTALFFSSSAAGQGKANPVGAWDLTTESPRGKSTSVLIIKEDGDKLSAVVKGSRGERPLDQIGLDGNNITFVLTIPFEGQQLVITYKGVIEADSMKGEADFGGFASGPWTAVRQFAEKAASVAAPDTDISGTWVFAVETAAGSGNPVFTFKQEGESLSGTYKGTFGEKDFIGVLKGGQVSFTFKVSFEGQDIEISYEGKVEGKDQMSGTVKLGDFGQGTWTAKRQ